MVVQNVKSFKSSQIEFMIDQFENLTDEIEILSPSELAEQIRYLPPSVSAVPGYYSYELTPYLREIIDNFDSRSPVREFFLMKGVQIGGTVGVLENGLLYIIAKIKSGPAMLITADNDLAKIRMENYITPMIQQSGLSDKIRSVDEGNSRKTGATARKLEWVGGGFLLPFGANNANKLKSFSIQYLLRDETTTFPANVSKQGSPLKLSKDRTNGYEQTRKICDISSPSIKGICFIEQQYLTGDQRKYHVPCLKCGTLQTLRWSGVDKETGLIYGMTWKLDDDNLLISDSVRYVCRECGHEHKNSDKIHMLKDEKLGGTAVWIPTAKPIAPDIRSYHLSALYSPPSMYSWESAVRAYLKCYDPIKKKVKDINEYQAFYNSVLGETFEVLGDKIKFNTVSSHRRSFYNMGEIPNVQAELVSGGKVSVVICTVDVHKDNLAVAVWGFCPGVRPYLLNYYRFEGECLKLDDETSWGELSKLIEEKEYKADDGRLYKIALTLIDSRYNKPTVNKFCSLYENSVYPIMGNKLPLKNTSRKEFSETKTSLGTTAFNITVDLYKDAWAESLKTRWDRTGIQPELCFNAPNNLPDKVLKELTVEYKKELLNPDGTSKGHEWHRPDGVDNELWDLLIYATAAIDILALSICTDVFELDSVDWNLFWSYIEKEQIFYRY